jgi:hypothetical protein
MSSGFELTLHEVWKKKNVRAGQKPEAWRVGEDRLAGGLIVNGLSILISARVCSSRCWVRLRVKGKSDHEPTPGSRLGRNLTAVIEDRLSGQGEPEPPATILARCYERFK